MSHHRLPFGVTTEVALVHNSKSARDLLVRVVAVIQAVNLGNVKKSTNSIDYKGHPSELQNSDQRAKGLAALQRGVQNPYGATLLIQLGCGRIHSSVTGGNNGPIYGIFSAPGKPTGHVGR